MTHRGPFQPLLFCDSVILYVQVYNTQQEESVGNLPQSQPPRAQDTAQ